MRSDWLAALRGRTSGTWDGGADCVPEGATCVGPGMLTCVARFAGSFHGSVARRALDLQPGLMSRSRCERPLRGLGAALGTLGTDRESGAVVVAGRAMVQTLASAGEGVETPRSESGEAAKRCREPERDVPSRPLGGRVTLECPIHVVAATAVSTRKEIEVVRPRMEVAEVDEPSSGVQTRRAIPGNREPHVPHPLPIQTPPGAPSPPRRSI